MELAKEAKVNNEYSIKCADSLPPLEFSSEQLPDAFSKEEEEVKKESKPKAKKTIAIKKEPVSPGSVGFTLPLVVYDIDLLRISTAQSPKSAKAKRTPKKVDHSPRGKMYRATKELGIPSLPPLSSKKKKVIEEKLVAVVKEEVQTEKEVHDEQEKEEEKKHSKTKRVQVAKKKKKTVGRSVAEPVVAVNNKRTQDTGCDDSLSWEKKLSLEEKQKGSCYVCCVMCCVIKSFCWHWDTQLNYFNSI